MCQYHQYRGIWIGDIMRLLSGLLAVLGFVALGASPGVAMDTFELGGEAKGMPAVVSSGKFGLMMFVRGSDDGLWMKRGDGKGGGWSKWTSLGGVLGSAPACATFKSAAHCFVRGGDSALWTIIVDKNGKAGGWMSLDVEITNQPGVAVASPDNETLGLFAFARGSDGNHYYRGMTYDAATELTGWKDWVGTGASGVASPGCSGILTVSINCFFRAPNGHVKEIAGALAADPAIVDIGGLTDHAVSSVSNSPSTVQRVIVRGQDGRLWIKTWKKSGGWNDWTPFDVTLDSAPSCTLEADGDLWCGSIASDTSLHMIRLEKDEY